MKVKLTNPIFEEFQIKLGICYLFVYGSKKNEDFYIKPQDPQVSKQDSLRTFAKSASKDGDFENSGKISMEKLEEKNIEKMIKDRKSGIPDGNVKNIFKDRHPNIKDDNK